MRLAIIGDGLLGLTLAEEAKRRDLFVIVYDHGDIEVTDEQDCAAMLDGFDVAINTAAFHRLDLCEQDPNRAFNVNANGAHNVAAVVPTVYISTDYVFADKGPHEEALPGKRPPSVYGKTKLAGELATLEQGGIVVRVSALFGHYPSHKGPTFPERVVQGYDPLRLPNDQTFSPTYAPDAAVRIVDLALRLVSPPDIPGIGKHPPTGIFHAANAGSTTWAQFAQAIAEIHGYRRHILPFDAKDPLRPRNSVLRSKRLPALRHWHLALRDWHDRYMAENTVSPLR